jgi:LacI family transcriptional regulator, galactose operon repressor
MSRTAPPPIANPPRVLVFMRRDFLAQTVLDGAIAYCQKTHRLELAFRAGTRFLRGEWDIHPGCKAVIGRIFEEEDRQDALELGVPVVCVEQEQTRGLPLVRTDDRAIGRMAFEHLWGKGFRRLAYCGPSDMTYSLLRQQAFLEAAEEAGAASFENLLWTRTERARSFGSWLAGLPKPLGLFADRSAHARQAAFACRDLGIAVPEEVAIVGVDDDPLVCKTAAPSLSAIDQGTFMIGYRAAELIDRMLNGEPAPDQPVLIQPLRLAERQSTDTMAIEDKTVARALAFVREHALEEIRIADVARKARVAPRTLQLRFRHVLGKSVHDEIHRVRTAHARRLLVETAMPTPDIAAHCGYSCASVLCRTFKEATGLTPRDYRKRHGWT